MREECPNTMAALESIGDDQAARDALPGQMELSGLSCGIEDVTGRVTNGSDQTVDVFIQIYFETADGTRVGDSNASVSALSPGQTAKWDAYVPEPGYRNCRAEVTSAFEA
jgi:hypothetical protein